MKKYLYFPIAALALASCSSDEYFGKLESTPQETPSGVIAFGSSSRKATRADVVTGIEAADKLNRNFIVYGFKYKGAEATDGSTKDPVVFDLYNVNYEDGTANTTESNTKNWEYVGYTAHEGSSESEQTIKYWDYESDAYIFSAVSGLGIEATKTKTGTSVYDKGWKVNIPAGGDLSTLYASDRNPVAKADYENTVTLTFRALGTKVRFAMYETVPGYSVHVDRFYYNDGSAWNKNETNFAIDGTFKTAKASAVTPLTITYYDNTEASVENRPKVSYNDADVTTGVYGTFGANIQAPGQQLGTTSVEATYDQSDKSYTMILPYENGANVLELYVDYTLTSTGGSGEQIKVKHASAKVPANYTQWRPNFAYTYIFKISDNTNGTTGDPTNPDDPTPNPGDDPTGLFPITFDAAVITEETDLQETITSVSEPSITTYAKGKIVTENDEYTAGDIYVTTMAGSPAALVTMTAANAHVFEVVNNDKEATTEEVIANYLNNFCTLTEVVKDITVTQVPITDGTNLTFTAGQVLKFTAEAGKTYVYSYYDGAKNHYKVIKVVGSPAAVTYTVNTDALGGSATTATAITATDGTATIYVGQNGIGVLGVKPCFAVDGTVNDNKALVIAESATAGSYNVTVDPAAIKAGKANDTYTVTFKGQTVTIPVNIAYVLRNAADDADITSVNIVAGNTTGATVVNKIAGAAADGDVTDVPEGITIEKTATGTYKVTAAATLANGAYSAKIAGQTLTINVDSYAFLSDLVITKALTGTSTGTLTLKKNGAAATGVTTLTGADAGVATFTAADGVYTFTAVAGGSFDVTYENAKAKVTVNSYSIATPASIKKSTGAANIEVKCNGTTTINASTASLVETNKPTGAVYNVTTNGKVIRFSNASKAGAYEFDYKVGTTVVAHVVITVTD